ncbi:hypothetical protein DM01DRAFT_1408274 [Hesseltinella vesiculosa]|uniref:Uncharacterized protein n=1 Tax=Hesseltinella vesiculosa TaxID=101127 RepID=A0A1X2GG50_9FUNG|nr:hypothetical protein DM01DRAFT_1408274 [Hesseltinella vesiculosa]
MSILDSQPAIVPSTFNAAFFESHCVKQWTFPYFVDWKNEDHDKISSLLREFSNSLDSLLTKNPQLHREVRQYVHQLKKTKLPETAAKQLVAEHLHNKMTVTHHHIVTYRYEQDVDHGKNADKSETLPSSNSETDTALLEESPRPRPNAPTSSSSMQKND